MSMNDKVDQRPDDSAARLNPARLTDNIEGGSQSAIHPASLSDDLNTTPSNAVSTNYPSNDDEDDKDLEKASTPTTTLPPVDDADEKTPVGSDKGSSHSSPSPSPHTHTHTNSTENVTENGVQQPSKKRKAGKAAADRPPIEEITKVDFGFLPIPKRCRFDPERPFGFGLVLTAVFGFTSTFVVANLYYCQPLLVKFADAFNVSYSQSSRIPTLMQAGYATGLVLLTPLGDLIRRRFLILTLILLSSSLSIGLATTTHFPSFLALNFLVGVVSVTPQVLIPLAADLAPPHRRASAISVVFGGLLFGVLIARVLAGIIAQYARYQTVYYLAIAVQTAVLFLCWCLVPDYPRKNKHLTYFDILWSMAKYAVTEPLLIQACLGSLLSSACFSSYWVTLTFLLSDEPYRYSTLVIGLFGLVGMFGVCLSPLVGRFVDRLTPWYAALLGTLGQMLGFALQTAAGGINVSAVVLAIILLDVFRQTFQVSQSAAIFGISLEARARLNAVYILSLFIGQVMGTSVGSKVFLSSGWRACAGLSLGWLGLVVVILLIRGPMCGRKTWVGWEGGWGAVKKPKVGHVGEGDGEAEGRESEKV